MDAVKKPRVPRLDQTRLTVDGKPVLCRICGIGSLAFGCVATTSTLSRVGGVIAAVLGFLFLLGSLVAIAANAAKDALLIVFPVALVGICAGATLIVVSEIACRSRRVLVCSRCTAVFDRA